MEGAEKLSPTPVTRSIASTYKDLVHVWVYSRKDGTVVQQME